MKNIFNKIKEFKYKKLTAIIFLLVTTLLGFFLPGDFCYYLSVASLIFLFIFGLYQYWISVINVFLDDNDIFNSLLFGIVGLVFITILFYVIIFRNFF